MKGFMTYCHKVATYHQHEHKKHKKQLQLPPEAEAKTATEEQKTEVKTRLQSSLLNNYSRALSQIINAHRGGVTQRSFFCSPNPVEDIDNFVSRPAAVRDDRGH